MPIKIEVKDVRKSFATDQGPLQVVEAASFSVGDGEFVALVGPSGCGKTTLMNIVAGFIRPDQGSIVIDGVERTRPSPKGIHISQHGSVFPWLTVRENLMFGLNGHALDDKAGLADLDRYYEPGRIQHAIDSFEDAVAADPGYAPGYVGLAEAYWRRYRENRDESLLRQAAAHAAQAVKLDSQLARAHVARGLVAVESRSMDEARNAFEKALLLDPDRARSLGERGRLAVEQNFSVDRMAEGALQVFEAAVWGREPAAAK